MEQLKGPTIKNSLTNHSALLAVKQPLKTCGQQVEALMSVSLINQAYSRPS